MGGKKEKFLYRETVCRNKPKKWGLEKNGGMKSHLENGKKKVGKNFEFFFIFSTLVYFFDNVNITQADPPPVSSSLPLRLFLPPSHVLRISRPCIPNPLFGPTFHQTFSL
jgi:hypothetical protein